MQSGSIPHQEGFHYACTGPILDPRLCCAAYRLRQQSAPAPAKQVVFRPATNFSPAADDVLFRALGLVGTRPTAGAATRPIRASIAAA